MFPLFHVQTVTLYWEDEDDLASCDRDLWTRCFGDARELRTVRALKGTVRQLIHALRPLQSDLSRVFAPSLTHIEMRDVSFRKPCGSSNTEGSCARCVRCLQDTLVRRSESGYPIAELTIIRCRGISSADVKMLEGVVDIVEAFGCRIRG